MRNRNNHSVTFKKKLNKSGKLFRAYNELKLEYGEALDLVKAFEKANNLKIKYEIKDRRPGDADENYADASKAYRQMGWKTELDIVDACRDSWNWQKNNPKDTINNSFPIYAPIAQLDRASPS